MTMYASTDLLTKFKQKARRPTSDASLSDPTIYDYLSQGQEQMFRRIAAIAPQVLYNGQVQLVTGDNGLSYTFGTAASGPDGENPFPFGQIEVRQGQRGRPLLPCADWQMGGDFVQEGDVIRFPGGKAKTFPGGLYARFIKRPPVITAIAQPTLKPVEARICIVDCALIEWATQVNNVDPAIFEAMLNKHWFGDPSQGDFGVLAMLKQQYAFGGVEAIGRNQGAWWYGIDDGSGYQPVR